MKRVIIVHCSATTGSGIGPERVASFHAQAFPNWSRALLHKLGKRVTGYNEYITRDGAYHNWENGAPCCPLDEQAAHTGDCSVNGTILENLNVNGIGICLEGGVDAQGRPENNYTPAQMKTLRERIRYYRERFPTIELVFGHRDAIKMARELGRRAGAKACPCFSVQTWMKTWDTGRQQEAELQKREDRLSFGDLVADAVNGVRSILAPETHKVSGGETLWGISNRYGMTVDELMEVNGLTDEMIKPDQILKVFQ